MKEPYLRLSKIQNKSNFCSVRGGWDDVGTFFIRKY